MAVHVLAGLRAGRAVAQDVAECVHRGRVTAGAVGELELRRVGDVGGRDAVARAAEDLARADPGPARLTIAVAPGGAGTGGAVPGAAAGHGDLGRGRRVDVARVAGRDRHGVTVGARHRAAQSRARAQMTLVRADAERRAGLVAGQVARGRRARVRTVTA